MSLLNREAWVTLVIALVAASPLVWAQSGDNTTADQDPSVNESDFDTNPPPADESYMNESDSSAPADPTVSENDFDTDAPPADESYLEDDPSVGEDDFDTTVPPGDDSYLAEDASGDPSGGTPTPAKTPAISLLLGVAVLGLIAVAMRRPRN